MGVMGVKALQWIQFVAKGVSEVDADQGKEWPQALAILIGKFNNN